MQLEAIIRGSLARLPVKSLVLVLVVLVSGCEFRCGGPRTAPTAGHNPMALSGAELWQIGELQYQISSTYYLALSEGLQFTIELPYIFSVPPSEFTEEQALDIAMPLMRHAYETGLYKRSQISRLGTGSVEPTRIGVALVQREGKSQRGYKVALPLEAIEASIGQPAP